MARPGPRQTPYPLPTQQDHQHQHNAFAAAPSADPPFEAYRQQQQTQPAFASGPPVSTYEHIPTGFQVAALPSVHDDLLRLEEECQSAGRAAKRLRGAAEEVGGLQRMGVDVDDETMSSFKVRPTVLRATPAPMHRLHRLTHLSMSVR